MTTTINGRTPEEIKMGLENGRFNCEFVECCETDCPYEAHCKPGSNLMVEIPSVLVRDALERIQQLERERDAAVDAVGKLVDNCDRSIACEFCEFRDYQCFVCEFKWRGVQEVE